MPEIIEHGDNGNTSVIVTDDKTPQISLKLYQDIYHQITGRTEKIRQKYSNDLLIDFPEIEQLHFKIMQLCDIHDVIASNEVVSVFHQRERKEQFTSFEKFKAYNSNATRPTVSVVLRYNFSIILSGLTKPQAYIVTIRLTSRIALLKQIESDIPAFIRGRIFRLVPGSIAEISVEYADYVVARSFLESFDEWVEGCKETPKNKIIDFIQSKSYLFPKSLQFILAIMLMFFCLTSIPEFFQKGNIPEVWARFTAIFGGGFYLLMMLSHGAGTIMERAIDNISPLSYLKLNKGDEKLINEFSSTSKTKARKIIMGCLITIGLGIISSKLAIFV